MLKSLLSFWPENKTLQWSYLLGILLYISLSIFFFDTFIPEFCPDTVSYLNIAKKYSSGNFIEAINAYWSPMISWLLVPFSWTNIYPFSGFKIVNCLTGLAFIILLIKIFERFNFNTLTRIFCFLTLIIFSFLYQASSATADFLSIFFVCFYLYIITNTNRFRDKNYFIKVATAAALGFFSKSYFLAFFIIQFFIFIQWDFFQHAEYRKLIIKNGIKTYALFFMIVGIWVSLLTYKYQKFIVSSSGTYNFSIMISENGSLGNKPQYYDIGLLPPSDPYAVSSWDDPTYYPVKTRNPFHSKENFLFQLEVIQYNLNILAYLFRWFSYFGLSLILILPYTFFISKGKSKDPAAVFIFSALIYLLGYLVIFYEERYVLPAYFILIISTFYILDDIMGKIRMHQLINAFLFICLSIAFLKNPLAVYKEISTGFPGGNIYKNAAMKLKEAEWLNNKRIASRYEYEMTGLVAFLNHGTSYGTINEKKSDEDNLKSLQENKIDYFFYYHCRNPLNGKQCTESVPQYLKNKPVVYEDSNLKLQVFKLR